MKEIEFNIDDLKTKFLKESGIRDNKPLLINGLNYGDFSVLVRNTPDDEDGEATYAWKDIGNDWMFVGLDDPFSGERARQWNDRAGALMAALEDGKTIYQFEDTFEMCRFIADQKIERNRKA